MRDSEANGLFLRPCGQVATGEEEARGKAAPTLREGVSVSTGAGFAQGPRKEGTPPQLSLDLPRSSLRGPARSRMRPRLPICRVPLYRSPLNPQVCLAVEIEAQDAKKPRRRVSG